MRLCANVRALKRFSVGLSLNHGGKGNNKRGSSKKKNNAAATETESNALRPEKGDSSSKPVTPAKAAKSESLDGMRLLSNRMGERAEATRTVKKRMSYDQHHGHAGGNR